MLLTILQEQRTLPDIDEYTPTMADIVTEVSLAITSYLTWEDKSEILQAVATISRYQDIDLFEEIRKRLAEIHKRHVVGRQ